VEGIEEDEEESGESALVMSVTALQNAPFLRGHAVILWGG